MDKIRPINVRNNSEKPGAPSSPMLVSPMNRLHMRSGSNVGSASNVRKAQTKAAAQRLAAVMAHQTGDEDDVEEELSFEYNAGGSGSIGRAGGKSVPSRSPMNRTPQSKLPQMTVPRSTDEDNEDDELSVDYPSGRLSIGLASGRAIRPQSPMAKTAPARRPLMTSQQPAEEEKRDDDDLSVGYASGKPSIGLGGGRAMRSQSSMTKIHPQKHPQTTIQQPADVENEDDDIPYDYPSGRPSIGLGGRATRPCSPMTKTPQPRRPQIVAQQPADEDNNDDNDVSSSYTSGVLSIGLAGGRSMRTRTPLSVRINQEQRQSGLSTSVPRPLSSEDSTEQPSSARLTSVSHQSQTTNSVEQLQSACSIMSNKSSLSLSSMDQPPSAHSAFNCRPVKNVPLVPATLPISLKPVVPAGQADTPTGLRRDKRISLDMGSMSNLKELGNQRSASVLQDEVDMLQEENEGLLEKLRLAEERCDEAEARARQLEKQVETLGEGVTLEARLLSRKEAALQQREAALRVAAQTHGGRNEDVSALQMEAEIARDEATSALKHLHEVESELKSLKTITKRVILTQEEMEEVILKRCWISRYWSLCVRHGIQADIAGAKHEYWSSFAPHPLETVLSAGQRARERVSPANDAAGERGKFLLGMLEVSGEQDIENMLLVEKGLRELASLKVQDAVACAMAQHRRQAPSKLTNAEEVKLPADGQFEAFELSEEEQEDVRFKQAWLMYFWRRAKNHEVEPDIADERLEYWINHSGQSSTSHDAVDVERGLMELRKMNIESQLWKKSRKGLEHESNPTSHLEHSF